MKAVLLKLIAGIILITATMSSSCGEEVIDQQREYYIDKISENIWFLSLNVDVLVRKYKMQKTGRHPINGSINSRELTEVYLKTIKKALSSIEKKSDKFVLSITYSGDTGISPGKTKKSTPIRAYFVNLKGVRRTQSNSRGGCLKNHESYHSGFF